MRDREVFANLYPPFSGLLPCDFWRLLLLLNGLRRFEHDLLLVGAVR
jgi:hypothetical protein